MIQATADRLGDTVPPERRLVLTSRALVEPVLRQLPGARVIGEPCRRDTAPCVGLAAVMALAEDPDAMLLVMPTDHVILDRSAFATAVRSAVKLLDQDRRRIVTFGVPPTYPAESFGYIQRGAAILATDEAAPAFQVQRFREKPDAATAESYLRSGEFLWNSGIFLWRADTILELLRRFEPAMAAHLDAIGQTVGTAGFEPTLEAEFQQIVGKSIDYAVLEHHDNVVVIQAPFDWDDVGSWQAIGRLQAPDESGNAVRARHIGIDTWNSIVYGEQDHLIVTIDVEDLIIVQTPDATLVAPKSAEEKVRKAVAEIEHRGWDEHL